MPDSKIEINSQSRTYYVSFDSHLQNLRQYKIDENSVFLVDKKVWNLYKEEFFETLSGSQVILIEASEENKEYFAIGNIIPKLTELSAKKNLTIIAIGGGIIQDIASFIASTLYRGVRWIFIPTTLLAQADSCIGAKSSINFGNFKNLLGTFWAPEEVWLSTRFIDTLDTKDFYSGIGEIIKLFLIDGKESLEKIGEIASSSEADLRANIEVLLRQALLIKKGYIEIDEFDKGVRNILNYGHCIGHAIESVTNYAVPHGQAVTLGMIWANIISVNTGILTKEKRDLIFNEYLKNSHTISLNSLPFTSDEIVNAMKKDKKREGEDLAIILMDEQNVFNRIKDLKASVIHETFDEFVALFN